MKKIQFSNIKVYLRYKLFKIFVNNGKYEKWLVYETYIKLMFNSQTKGKKVLFEAKQSFKAKLCERQERALSISGAVKVY